MGQKLHELRVESTGFHIWLKCCFVVTKLQEGIDFVFLISLLFLKSFNVYTRQFGRGLTLTGNKPLSLEYLADRLDTDDPLWGLTIRSKEEVDPIQQMQGFITLTTFTTWVRWFRWDSSAEIAAVNEFPKDLSKTGRVRMFEKIKNKIKNQKTK